MIKVTKENKYKVLKPELFQEGETLLGKYPIFWTNTSMTPTHFCFVKTFGQEDDLKFGYYSTIWLGFDPEANELKLHCTSYGGLARFVFNEEDLKRTDMSLSKNDRECMEFTIELIRNLQEQGIIEAEE